MKIRIIFLFQTPAYWPSWESFYHACLNDSRFDVKIVLLEEIAYYRNLEGNAREFLEKNNLQYILAKDYSVKDSKPHIAVLIPNYDVLYRKPDWYSLSLKSAGVKIVYIPYGIEIQKGCGLDFYPYTILNAWRIYTMSEAIKQEYMEYCPNRKAVRALGHPKFDSYKDLSKYKLPQEVKIKAKGRQIILLKLHFPKEIVIGGKNTQITPHLDVYIDFFNRSGEYKNFFFILRPHPLFLAGYSDAENQEKAKNLLEKAGHLENVYIDNSNDYRTSLVNADAIIIDRSAIMVEAGITDVPVLYMYNSDFYEPLAPPVQKLIDSYYSGCKTEDILNFLDMLKKGEDSKRELRSRTFREVVPFLDGNCGERIKNDIVQSIESQSKKIKIVLFGLGEVLNLFIEELGIFKNEHFEVVAFCDNNEVKWGEEIYGLKILSPKEIIYVDFDYIVVTTENFYFEIAKKLICELNFDPRTILRLDEFWLNYWGRK